MFSLAVDRHRRHPWSGTGLMALLAAALVLMVLAALWGTGLQSRPVWAAEDPWESEPVAFERPASVPQEVAQWVASLQERQGLHRMHHGDRTWIMVAWGAKPTGGYIVDVEDVQRTRTGVVVLSVDLRVPGPGDIVTQAITYPYDLVAIDRTDAPLAAEFGPRPTPWLPEQEGLPLVSESVFLLEPAHGAVLDSTVKVKGAAQLFEGTYHVVLEDGHNQLLNQLGTASAGGPEWGVIDEELSFPMPSSPHGHLIIMWQDPESGAWVEEVAVPVTFAAFEPVDGDDAPAFTDMAGHWAAETVQEAVERGFVHGYPDGTFRPEGRVTRAEFLKMVMAAFTFAPTPPVDEAPFPDTTGHWANDYVRAGLHHGILTMDEYDGLFEPDRPITRLEMAVWVVRALGLAGEIAGHIDQAGAFSDTAQLDEEARGYIGTAVHLDILRGYPDGTVGPQRESTRAEAVTVILRALAALDEQP